MHLVAYELDRNRLRIPPPADLDLHGRSLRATEVEHRLLGRPSFGGLIADFCDDVATPHARSVRGRSFEDDHRRDVAIRGLDRHADSVVSPLLPLAHLRVLARVEEARVRIQCRQHSPDGAVHEPVGVDLVDIARLDRTQCGRKGLVMLGDAIVDRQRAASEQAANQGGDRDSEKDGGDRVKTSHD